MKLNNIVLNGFASGQLTGKTEGIWASEGGYTVQIDGCAVYLSDDELLEPPAVIIELIAQRLQAPRTKPLL